MAPAPTEEIDTSTPGTAPDSRVSRLVGNIGALTMRAGPLGSHSVSRSGGRGSRAEFSTKLGVAAVQQARQILPGVVELA
jgi:hypothetical protein